MLDESTHYDPGEQFSALYRPPLDAYQPFPTADTNRTNPFTDPFRVEAIPQ